VAAAHERRKAAHYYGGVYGKAIGRERQQIKQQLATSLQEIDGRISAAIELVLVWGACNRTDHQNRSGILLPVQVGASIAGNAVGTALPAFVVCA
jgi:hypothetical protein